MSLTPSLDAATKLDGFSVPRPAPRANPVRNGDRPKLNDTPPPGAGAAAGAYEDLSPGPAAGTHAVGAGDALLAGFLAGGLPEALAYAAAAVRHVGTHAPPVTAEDRAAVRVNARVDGNRRLG